MIRKVNFMLCVFYNLKKKKHLQLCFSNFSKHKYNPRIVLNMHIWGPLP